MRIAILGAGNMGCALAIVLARKRHDVVLWSVEYEVVTEIVQSHATSKYLPGIPLDAKRITATEGLADALRGARGVIVAVPSHVVAGVAKNAARHIAPRTPVLSVAKGILADGFVSLPDTIARALGRRRGTVAGLAGPAVATEFARGTPTAVVCAGAVLSTKFWKRALHHSAFHVEESRDIVGVSWAATLKNCYAIALGMCDGMRYALNTKAILTTHALAEMAMFLRSVRALPATAYGLAGIGDLVTTGFSPHGRNRRFGETICADASCSISEALKTRTVEGIAAVVVARAWARRKRLTLPLLETVWRVCHRRADPCRALQQYLRRS